VRSKGKLVGPPPDGYQGWGRLSMSGSLPLEGFTDPRVRLQVLDRGQFFAPNQSICVSGIMATGTGPISVVLAYYDYPGDLIATKMLVNDLNLIVIADRYNYTGNNEEDEVQPVADSVNTVEKVLLKSPQPGANISIVVEAPSLPSSILDPTTPQRWAVAVVGHFSGYLESELNPFWAKWGNRMPPSPQPPVPPTPPSPPPSPSPPPPPPMIPLLPPSPRPPPRPPSPPRPPRPPPSPPRRPPNPPAPSPDPIPPSPAPIPPSPSPSHPFFPPSPLPPQPSPSLPRPPYPPSRPSSPSLPFLPSPSQPPFWSVSSPSIISRRPPPYPPPTAPPTLTLVRPSSSLPHFHPSPPLSPSPQLTRPVSTARPPASPVSPAKSILPPCPNPPTYLVPRNVTSSIPP
ncbi:hypothetical protein Vretifemale_12470, partial [Volvox reticuliferus]